MAMAFRFSERLKLCRAGDADRMARHLVSVGLPASVVSIRGELPGAAELLAIMRQDKKAQAGKLTFILVRGIGEAFIARDVADDRVREFLAEELEKR
jgi:3-dehydroquinate synthetase